MASDTDATSTVRKPSTSESSAGCCAISHVAPATAPRPTRNDTRFILQILVFVGLFIGLVDFFEALLRALPSGASAARASRCAHSHCCCRSSLEQRWGRGCGDQGALNTAADAKRVKRKR